MCCSLISKINALVYHGRDIQEYIKQWDYLVDMAACRNGSVIFHEKIIVYLGLQRIKIPRCDIPKHMPAEISFFVSSRRSSSRFFHTGLVIETKNDLWTIVNYKGGKELIMTVPRNEISFANREDSITDRHYHLLLK